MNEAELVFIELLRCDRASLYLNKSMILESDRSSFICDVLKKRIKSEPIQYILGWAEFMGLRFKVNKHVLIPRPETEILVEAAIKLFSTLSPQRSALNILDLGTGCGCIAVSLAKFLPDIRITATDISKEALKLARHNAEANGVTERIDFVQSDLFKAASLKLLAYDIIVSNPPYIPNGEIESLQPEVRQEPRIAIDGGVDGLDFYRRIIRDSAGLLKKTGYLILEMGFAEKCRIEDIFRKSGNFEIIETVKDYGDIDRVISAKRKSDG